MEVLVRARSKGITIYQLLKEARIANGAAKTLTTMGKALMVSQLFSTVVDVMNLVNSWRSDHSLVEPIDYFIRALQHSVQKTKGTLKFVEIVTAETFRNMVLTFVLVLCLCGICIFIVLSITTIV